MNRSSRVRWAVLNAMGLTAALVCNGLANALPLNGKTTGELSALYPNLFVPAGYTFSIWGLIYLGLLALVARSFAQQKSDGEPHPVDAIGPWFLVNTLANGAWILAWHWTLVPLSLALMGVLLASLIAMYLRLGIGRRPTSTTDRWLVHAPISLYLGWISVATIANTTALAVHQGAPAFGQVPAFLTIAVLGVAVGLAVRMLWSLDDVVFAGVICWALLGVAVGRSGSEQDGAAWVFGAAVAGLVFLVLAIGGTLLRGVSSSEEWR